MACPVCGDICRCASAAHSAASPRWLADADAVPAAATVRAEAETPGPEALRLGQAAEAAEPDDDSESAPEESPAWRQEVAARLNRYQARRKPRPPRYPSLRLRLGEQDPALTARDAVFESPPFLRRAVTASNQALALDGFADSAADALASPALGPLVLPAAFPRDDEPPQTASPSIVPAMASTPAVATIVPTTAKIIEFPRSWTPPPAPLDELAEPVFDRDRPRILEAPEFVAPPPALGGITIEPSQRPELEKRPGIDIPLQSAPLARRIFSAAVDGVIIAAACALFGLIFWKVTAIRPPQLQIVGLAAGLSSVLWAAYQYLLLVYSGSTPGLRLARLELARFDGRRASRRLRRWRVLASFLSAASLAMGYAWVFLDEDSLCWHDRITHTYLAPKGLAAIRGNLTG